MESNQEALMHAKLALAQQLESLQRAGVQQVRKVPPPTGRSAKGAVSAATPQPASPVSSLAPTNVRPAAPIRPVPQISPSTPAESAMPRAKAPPAAPLGGVSLVSQPYPTDLPASAVDRQKLLDELNAQVRGCKLCKELACARQQTVFGVGNPKPRVAFFGEAPGADEDRQGEPFVGRAGQLLTKIIEACTWKREDVYILNVLKCRPPENRNPLPGETDNCRQYFERQFEILRPEYIVCVGTVPAQALLETEESVGKLRGRFHKYRSSTVLVTYHPSYLLRNPAAKKFVWEDMQMLLGKMGIPIPGKSGG